MFVPRQVDLAALLARQSWFVFGPRQTGKTTLLRQQLGGVRQFNLLESGTYLMLHRAPQRLREVCTGQGEPVVIDEIQKLPQLLDEVHRLIEERQQRFLLTGSSRRKLGPGGASLLGGRAGSLQLHPFSAAELGERFELDRALNNGLLPAIYSSSEPDADLRAWLGTYLRDEVASEALTRDVPAFARFLEVAALCNGEPINYSKAAADAQIARTTVQEYFQILRDTLIGQDVPPWRKTRKRRAVATAKFYLFDPGVVRCLRGTSGVRAPSPEYGHAFETWVCHELKTWADYHRGVELCHWRTPTGHEVDFVLGGQTAIAVKATANVQDRHVRGLLALAEERLLRRHIVVCLEERLRKAGGIEVMPWQAFVSELWSGRLAAV